MTLYYDAERNAVIENHPDYIYYEDDEHGGERLVIDFEQVEADRKTKSLLEAATNAIQADEVWELVEEPAVKWSR